MKAHNKNNFSRRLISPKKVQKNWISDKFLRKNKKKRFDVVAVFPFDKKNKKILLIQEYRLDWDKNLWKFVTGGMDKNISALQTAKEELAEEISMESDNWTKFYMFEKIFSSIEIHYFIAENPRLMKNPPENPDEHDFIVDQKWVNLEKLWEMIDKKEIIWKESVLVAINFLRSIQ